MGREGAGARVGETGLGKAEGAVRLVSKDTLRLSDADLFLTSVLLPFPEGPEVSRRFWGGLGELLPPSSATGRCPAGGWLILPIGEVLLAGADEGEPLLLRGEVLLLLPGPWLGLGELLPPSPRLSLLLGECLLGGARGRSSLTSPLPCEGDLLLLLLGECLLEGAEERSSLGCSLGDAHLGDSHQGGLLDLLLTCRLSGGSLALAGGSLVSAGGSLVPSFWLEGGNG